MEHSPVRTTIQTESGIPFRLVYSDTKSPQNELPDHLHDWHEIIYVYRGQGSIFIDAGLEDMQEGDLFLIPGSTVHRALPDAGNPVTSSALFFSPGLLASTAGGMSSSLLHPFERCRKRRIYKRHLNHAEQTQVSAFIDDIHAEFRSDHHLSSQAALLRLQLLLIFLERLDSATGPALATSSLPTPSWLSSILSDIDLKLRNRLTLPELAQQAAVSPAHLSRAFKRYTGMTLTDYVLARRVIMAKEHLLNGDETMAAVADACGFDSLPHFYRQFKKLTGTTPAAYRRTMVQHR
ncbi:AraC family transcriptional regulator [Paenibacillus polysaccharolyticus]|uniref:AraC family transcriptional regulator n=1 Tax=Paenibacillus polysaccharolyticus TaxID=582692 RepID=UPI00209DBF4D|nr:AraC family transcriptional regulator [Paenibacillus polysaccharolyticus]MCP1134680.1 AraC family transcriptional regulator [Paenibacillus polysaccharolyticus]